MGPVLVRQHFELLRPLVDRLFGIMVRKGLIPTAPAAIQGKDIKVRYTSLIARAQRMQELQGVNRAIATLQPLAAVVPTVMDVVKTDEVVREVWDVLGLPAKLLLTKQELDKKRDMQQKAQAMAGKQQQEEHQSNVAKNVAPLVQAAGNLQQGAGQPGGT